MTFLPPTLLALLAAALLAVVGIRSHGSMRLASAPEAESIDAAEAAGAIRRAQTVLVVALLVGTGGGLVTALLPIDRLGTASVIAPGIGAILACLVVVLAPHRAPRTGIRIVDLTPRFATAFGTRWGFIPPIVATALFFVFAIMTAVNGKPDAVGRLRAIYTVTPGDGTREGVYPGWFSVAPLLVVCGLLVVVALVALRRITLAPKTVAPAIDRAIRSTSTRFVMLVASGCTMLYLGAIALASGSTLRGTAEWSELRPYLMRRIARAVAKHGSWGGTFGPRDFITGVVQPQYAFGVIEAIAGLVVIAGALTLIVVAVAGVRIRWSVSAPSEPEKVDA